jgi:hypothetical protein
VTEKRRFDAITLNYPANLISGYADAFCEYRGAFEPHTINGTWGTMSPSHWLIGRIMALQIPGVEKLPESLREGLLAKTISFGATFAICPHGVSD